MQGVRIGLAIATASLAVAAALWPAVAGASFLGANGPILFTAEAPGSGTPDVWSVNADGSGLVNLTDLPGGAGQGRDPSASAGGLVAFATGTDAAAEIWTMNTDGSAAQPITSNAALDESPAVSPDGSRIAFVSTRDGAGDFDIWAMAADGAAQALLLDGAGRDLEPVYTPGGDQVLTASEVTGDFDIAHVPATGGPHPAATAITAQSDLDERSASPTPDGVRLAYSRPVGAQDDILSAYYNGTDEFPVAVEPLVSETSPSYSPDGTAIVYVTPGGLVIADSGGAAPAPLDTGAVEQPRDPDWAVGPPPDTDPPETAIDKRPKKKSAKRKAKFRFSSDEPGSSFECTLDRKPFAPCDSPRKYKRLKAKRHKFLVRAIDAAGNADPSPAKARFRVVEPE